ncbi:zinc ribbon domain-containing protein [bacterium]|nr:zinc ribbon domain-containing protein [bacterium]
MPIYEFFCDDCQKKFDVLCSMSADLSAISCEYCDGKHVMKKVSGFAVVGLVVFL